MKNRFSKNIPPINTIVREIKKKAIFIVAIFSFYCLFPNSVLQAASLINGGVIQDSISVEGEEDTYSFSANAGEGIVIRMADVNDDTLVPYLQLYGPDGNLIVGNSGHVASIFHTVATSGSYTVIAKDGSTYNKGTGSYNLYFAHMPGANEGGSLPNGGIVSDQIDLGDIDTYTFSANTGESIMVRIADINNDTLTPYIRLYGPDGTVIGGDSGSVAALSYTATANGTYTVVVTDGSNYQSGTGNYNLYFTHMPGANEGGLLSQDGVVSDQIDLGDLDSYTFNMSAGESLMIRMADINNASLKPRLRLFSPNGSAIAANNGTVATISYTAETSGIYTLIATDSSTYMTGTGSYNLYYTHIPGANEGGLLHHGSVVSGQIDLGDLDSYTFSMSAGVSVKVSMTDINNASLNPRLRLFSPNGSPVAANNGTVATINYTAETSGIYTLIATDSSTYKTGTGSYNLSFEASTVGEMYLTMNPSAQSIQINKSLILSGRLIRLPEDPNNPIDLSEESLRLSIIQPDGTEAATFTKTVGSAPGKPNGYYTFDLGNYNSPFDQEGEYQIIVKYEGNESRGFKTKSVGKPLQVLTHAGYVILVQGAFDNGDGDATNDGLKEHSKTTNNIYAVLKNRGFTDDHIYYLSYDASSSIVDGSPTNAEFLNTIAGINPAFPIVQMMSADPAPFYLIMVDHGSEDYFYIENGDGIFDPEDDRITVDQINEALNTFEANIDQDALNQNRTIIYGACHSGSFLPVLSQSPTAGNAGRTIITSSAYDEVSYQGPEDPQDGIRSGEYFIDVLFEQLEKGYSFNKAFKKATAATEAFTQGDTTQANNNAPYFDNSVQHPLLDDNGDFLGSNQISDYGKSDGSRSNKRYLGFGKGPVIDDETSCDISSEITNATTNLVLAPTIANATLSLMPDQTLDPTHAWVEIRKPSISLQKQTGQLQLVNQVDRFQMTQQTANDNSTYWSVDIDSYFQTSGRYELYYYIARYNGEAERFKISKPYQGVIYKQKDGNQPPAPPENYTFPANNSRQSSTNYFSWTPAIDPESDDVRYVLQITDSSGNYSEPDFEKVDIRGTQYRLDECANLNDLTTYYWRIISVDEFGNKAAGPEQSFNTDNTNGIPGILQGIIQSDLDLSRLAACNVASSLQSGIFTVSDETGEYVLLLDEGLTNVTASLTNFIQGVANEIDIQAGVSSYLNFSLSPDSDNDGVPDLEDAFPDDPDESRDTDTDGTGDNADLDDDNDGMTDEYETANGLNPLVDDSANDLDDDGFTNLEEFEAGTAANDHADTPRKSSVILKILPLLLE